MGKDGRDKERKSGRGERPMLLDMGLGSREQGFCAQEHEPEPEPKLKLVHSQDSAPA